MRAVGGCVLFDFDGTLAERTGTWSQCVLDVLDERVPNHGASLAEVREGLRSGFPWHEPDHPHPELCDPDRWWAHVGQVFVRLLRTMGLGGVDAADFVARVRRHYCDTSRFRLFPDALPALGALERAGWRSAIVSNHVPELADIVEHLGLMPFVDGVFSSAITGYEKPHPDAFRIALRTLDAPTAWVVGDNPTADVGGAEAAGLPAMLISRGGDNSPRLDLVDAVDRILGAPRIEQP